MALSLEMGKLESTSVSIKYFSLLIHQIAWYCYFTIDKGQHVIT